MTTYYTYNPTTKRLTRAADPATIDGRMIVHPTAAMYASINAYPLGDTTPPTPPEGKIVVQDGYELQYGEWRPHWVFDDAPPPPPRRWTRLSIKTALAQAGLIDAARQFLSATEIATGYTAWEALTDCDYIEEGYPDATRWNAILDGAAVALGKTRAEIDAFLDSLPSEG